MKENLFYSTLVHSLPTILSALNIVSDDLDNLAEIGEVDSATSVMLELATTNLSNLVSEHKKRLKELEQEKSPRCT